MTEGSEFELGIQSDIRFHCLGAEAWNAWESTAVLQHDS